MGRYFPTSIVTCKNPMHVIFLKSFLKAEILYGMLYERLLSSTSLTYYFSLKVLLCEQFQLEICPYLLFHHWSFFGIGISLSHDIFYQIIHYFNGFCKALVFKYRVYPLAIKKIAWRRQKIPVNVGRFKIQISFYYNFCDRYRYIYKISCCFSPPFPSVSVNSFEQVDASWAYINCHA